MFQKIDLYPVITEQFCAKKSSLEVLDAVLAAGVRIVQLREKHLEKRALYGLALEYRKRTEAAGALLFINDHLDIALAVDADGVHLGQQDLPLEAARPIAPDILIGISTHDLEQALEAIGKGADAINIGPIFPTGTKPEHKTFLGPEGLSAVSRHVRIPYSVMGGINLENIDRVLAVGARKIAVVTAVTAAPDPRLAAAALRERILTSG